MRHRIYNSDDGALWVHLDEDSEIRVHKTTPAGVGEGVSLTTCGPILAHGVIRLASVLRLADELERLDVGGTVDGLAGHDTDVFIAKVGERFSSEPRYMLEIDGERIGDIETATAAARLAYGVPSPPDLAQRVEDNQEDVYGVALDSPIPKNTLDASRDCDLFTSPYPNRKDTRP